MCLVSGVIRFISMFARDQLFSFLAMALSETEPEVCPRGDF